MAINQNHISEELNGVKCAIVEKNVSKERVAFLERLLSFNKYIVQVTPTPPSKDLRPTTFVEGELPPSPQPPIPETFTVGVTDMMFNPINAIFGRLLHTPDGHIITQAYWYQKEQSSRDEIPYYERKV